MENIYATALDKLMVLIGGLQHTNMLNVLESYFTSISVDGKKYTQYYKHGWPIIILKWYCHFSKCTYPWMDGVKHCVAFAVENDHQEGWHQYIIVGKQLTAIESVIMIKPNFL